MKRKYANYQGWKRILQSRLYGANIDTPEFKGYINLFCMDAVRAPLVVEWFGRELCIVDTGYTWLKQYPSGEHFIVTAQFNQREELVSWYIDICLRSGTGEDNILWVDDLYLDLVVSPELEIVVKDADELMAARESGEITMDEYDLAWREADRLRESINRHQFRMLELSDVRRRMLLQANGLTDR